MALQENRRRAGRSHSVLLRGRFMKLGSKSVVAMLAAFGCFLLVAGAYAEEQVGPITIVSHMDIKPDAYIPQAEEKS